MKIHLNDPRVKQAIEVVKSAHSITNIKELEKVFEDQYHCKIVYEDAPLYLSGHLDISEEKYRNWFILQFGAENE